MIHRIYFVLLLLFFPFIANAQIGKELILNGSFEDYPAVTTPVYDDDDEDDEPVDPNYFDPYLKPVYWYFNSSLSYSRVKDVAPLLSRFILMVARSFHVIKNSIPITLRWKQAQNIV